MAVTDKAQAKLDKAIKTITDEGHTIWGFLLNADGSELQPFGNTGDSIEVFIHNMEEGIAAMKDIYQIDSKKNEA